MVALLEANDAFTGAHVDDVIAVFKDKSCCEDFRLHLKMFEMDKLKGNAIGIELMLTELDSKCTNIVRQKEWLSSTPASSIDSKNMAMLASENKQIRRLSYYKHYLLNSKRNQIINHAPTG